LAFLCVAFSVWFGIRNWNKDGDDDTNSKNSVK